MSQVQIQDKFGALVTVNPSDGGLDVHVINGGSGGTAATDESAFQAGVSTGTPIMGEDPTSGELLIVQLSPGTRKLAVAASVTVTPTQSSTASAAGPTTVGTASATALAANAARVRLTIQNTGTTRLYILFGTGTANAANYHLILPAGGSSNDGSSSPYIDQMWTGAVQWASSAAGGQGVAYENT